MQSRADQSNVCVVDRHGRAPRQRQWFLASALVLVCSLPAAAQQDQAEYTSINAALQKGYEIKSTAFIDSTQAAALAKTNDALIIVTLQKGASLVICTPAAYNWIYAVPATFKNEELCRFQGPGAH